MSELSKRVLTGIIGGALLLTVIIAGGTIGVFVLTSLMAFAMIFEFSSMAFVLPDMQEKKYLLLILTWLVCLGTRIAAGTEFGFLAASFLLIFGYFLFTAGKYEDEMLFRAHFREFAAAILGLVYLVFVPLYFRRIHDESAAGMHWFIVFLLIVFSGDTGAYFGGRKWGKKKLYPRISPKKTREGAVTGLASGYVVVLLYKLIFFRGLPWAAWLVMPLLVGVTAQVGDLCESLLKRAFDKKDSGAILPGHGGFLDRFDGVVFSAPVMYACIRIFS